MASFRLCVGCSRNHHDSSKKYRPGADACHGRGIGSGPVVRNDCAGGRSRPANKVTTKAVAEPLKKAQEAMKNKQWDAALTEIKKAQASEKKTPFEAYQIDEFLGYVLIQQKKFAEATPVFERMLNSRLPAARAGRRAHQDRRAAVLPGEGLHARRPSGPRSGSTSIRATKTCRCCSASRTTC